VRRRFWVVGGAVLAVVVVVVGVVVLVGGGLSREVTLDVAAPEPDSVDVVFGGDDTAYVSYFADRRHRVVAIRAGADEPLWTTAFADLDTVQLAMTDGVLLMLTDCTPGCDTMVALDPGTGKTRWTTKISVPQVLGVSGGRLVVYTAANSVYTGVAALDPRSGRVAWRFGDGRDRFALVPGTTRLAHYDATGTLRLVDVATGRATEAVDVPAYQDGESTLSATDSVVVLSLETGSSVHDAGDLTELWTAEGLIHPVRDDRFYRGGVVTDDRGRELWRTEERIFRTAPDAAWGYTQTYEARDRYRTNYVDLTTGDVLTDGWNTPVHTAPDGVLEVDSHGIGTNVGTGTSLDLWYVELPTGDRTDLGTLDVYRESCEFGATHLVCLDTDGQLGMWSYR